MPCRNVYCLIFKESQLKREFLSLILSGSQLIANIFALLKWGAIKTQHLAESVDMVLDAFRSDTRKGLTIENLLADFGCGSSNARNVMQNLYDGLYHYLNSSGHNKIKMMFEEWRTMYGQVADMSAP